MKKRSVLTIVSGFIITLIYLIFFLISSAGRANSTPIEEKILGDSEYLYLVYDVVDGDTIKIEYDNAIESVRLIGIDTPEVGECYFNESKEYLQDLLEAQFVKVAIDPTQGRRDKYDRLLLYVWKKDLFVNQAIIQNGYAVEYTYNLPYQYVTEFRESEILARASAVGLWSECE